MHPNGTVHYNIDCICMFDINSIQLDSFIIGTNENSKNIHVLHDVTPEERKNLREKKNGSSIFLEDMQGLEKLNNISFPKASMSRKE